MTQRNDARLAGIIYLSYIVFTMTSVIIYGHAVAGTDILQRFSNMTRMVTEVHISILLDLLQVICALVLAVTLYRLTYRVDKTLAMIAMLFRAGEGLLGASSIGGKLQLMQLATTVQDHAANTALLGNYVFNKPDADFSEFCFVIGGFLFAYLFLRGRLIPSLLAWLGVVTIGIQAICVPLQIAGFLRESVVDKVWLLIML
ncbi:MAG: DUF4386 domain-containing protein, partial [Candidatus Saccharimonadales bacterium]